MITSLLYRDLTYKVRGAIFTVYNTLGPGHKEVLYQRSLEKELQQINIPFTREPKLPIRFREEIVGTYQPDFVIDKKLILEIKAVEYMPPHFIKQLVYYLKGTSYKLGLLANFGPRLEIIRKIWSPSVKSALNP